MVTHSFRCCTIYLLVYSSIHNNAYIYRMSRLQRIAPLHTPLHTYRTVVYQMWFHIADWILDKGSWSPHKDQSLNNKLGIRTHERTNFQDVGTLTHAYRFNVCWSTVITDAHPTIGLIFATSISRAAYLIAILLDTKIGWWESVIASI